MGRTAGTHVYTYICRSLKNPIRLFEVHLGWDGQLGYMHTHVCLTESHRHYGIFGMGWTHTVPYGIPRDPFSTYHSTLGMGRTASTHVHVCALC